MSSVQHKSIASILDFGVLEEGLPYIISEHLPGSNLQDILLSVRRLSLSRAAFVGTHVSEALAHAHEHGLVHEMLNPSDIYVVRDKDGSDVIKVSDFGLSPMLAKLGLDLKSPIEQAEAIGTAAYMSPEQCTGREVDGRSDLYSLGCILYQCLGGVAPFSGADSQELIRMHKHSRYAPLPSVCPEIEFPPQLLDIVDKCLSKDAYVRYQYAHDLNEDLLNKRSPNDRERLVSSGQVDAITRAAARAEEAARSPMLPLAKVTAVLAVAVVLVLASAGLLSFVSRFANEGAWQSSLNAARKQYLERRFHDGIDSASTALHEAEKFAKTDPRLAITLNELAAGQIILESYVEAAGNLNRAIELENSSATETRTKARTKQLLAQCAYGGRDYVTAETTSRQAIELWQQVGNAKASESLPAHLALIRALCAQNKLDDAKAAYEVARVLAAGDSDLPEQVSGDLRQCLALLCLAEGDAQTAETILKELLGTRQRTFGLKDPLAAETMILLGQVYREEKLYEEATAVLESAFGILKDSCGPETLLTASVPGYLAAVQDEAGNVNEAEKSYRLSLEMQEKIRGPRSPQMVPYINALGQFLRRRGFVNAASVYDTEIGEIKAGSNKTTSAQAPSVPPTN